MLRWQATPDEVFQDILHETLEWTIDLVEVYQPHHVLTENEEANREESYSDGYQLSAKFFSRKEFVNLLGSLLEASDDNGTLHQLTDYHWLLLYESLKVYTDVRNDDGEPIKCGRYRIGRLDFDHIVDLYFWDTDFLVPEFGNVPQHVREQMGVNPETWGLSHGLKPHAEELLVVLVVDGDEPRHPISWSGETVMAMYPPESWPDDQDRPEMWLK